MDKDLRKKLQNVKNLAPGDFKVVRDRFSFYPKEEIHHELLIDNLEKEALLKPESAAKNQIGF